MKNENLLLKLNNALNALRDKTQHHANFFEKDLAELGRIMNSSLKQSYRSIFFEKNDMVKHIMKIMNKIDKAIKSLELEMHGVANYSNYEKNKINVIALKQSVKNELKEMLDMILAARPEFRNEELSYLIKQLR